MTEGGKYDRVYLAHMRDAMGWILEYGKMEREVFLVDHKTQMAMIREFEVMGEAAKRVSPGLRERNPDIPWRRIAGLRDVVIHQYEGVNVDLLWEFAKKDVPKDFEKIESILVELGEPEKG